MTQATLAHTPPAPPTDPESTLTTRFGVVTVDPERLISFENGLLGFPRHKRFLLTEVPGRDLAFKLLQSVDDPKLGFLVLPLDPEGGPIARADLAATAATLGFAFDALAVLAVVTLRNDAEGPRCTANLRAPLMIDTERRIGCQYVLAREAYDVRHPLQPGNGDAR